MANETTQQQPSDPLAGEVRPTKKERFGGIISAITGAGREKPRGGSPLDQALDKMHARRKAEAQLQWKNYQTYLPISHMPVGSPDPTTGNPLTQEDIEKYKTWATAAKEAYIKAANIDKETKAKMEQVFQQAEAVAPVVVQKARQGQGGGGMTPPPQAAQPQPAQAPAAQPAVQQAPQMAAPPQYTAEGMATAPEAAAGLEAQRDLRRKITATTAMDQAAIDQRTKNVRDLGMDVKSRDAQDYILTGKFPTASGLQVKQRKVLGEELPAGMQTLTGDPVEPDKEYDVIEDRGSGTLVAAASGEEAGKRFTYLGPNSEPLIGTQRGNRYLDQEGNPLPPGTEVYARGAMGTETLRQQITIGPGGQPQINTLETIRTPFKPGTKPPAGKVPPAATSPAAGPAKRGMTPPPQAQAAPPRPSATGGAPSAAGGRDALGRPLGITPGMYNAQLKRVTAVREANTQVFGDPENPEFRSLVQFARLADDQESQARLGTALKLTFDQLEQNEKAHGSFVGLMQAYLGMPQALADAKAGVQKDVIDQLNPEEQDAYNATISAFSSVVGLRSLTSASAAQFSVKALERDIPIIGVNATSSRQFYDKLAHIGEIAYNGSKGIPDVVMPQSEKEFYRKQLEDIRRRKEGRGSRSGITPPPKAGSTPTDDEIMREIRALKGAGRAPAKPSPQP